jgi:hypothetical protein
MSHKAQKPNENRPDANELRGDELDAADLTFDMDSGVVGFDDEDELPRFEKIKCKHKNK